MGMDQTLSIARQHKNGGKMIGLGLEFRLENMWIKEKISVSRKPSHLVKSSTFFQNSFYKFIFCQLYNYNKTTLSYSRSTFRSLLIGIDDFFSITVHIFPGGMTGNTSNFSHEKLEKLTELEGQAILASSQYSNSRFQDYC